MEIHLAIILRKSAAFCIILVYFSTIVTAQIDWDDDDDPGKHQKHSVTLCMERVDVLR